MKFRGSNDGKILYILDSGKTLRDIILEGDYNLKAYIFMNFDDITKMIIVWRKFNANQILDNTHTIQ